MKKALNFFEILREEKNLLRKKPATAELLNWLSVLHGEMFKEIDDPLSKEHQEKLVQTLGVLVKNKDDQERAWELLRETLDT